MTVLAAVDSTGYKIVLLIHVLAVIVGFAPLWLTPVMVRLTAGGDKAAADGLRSPSCASRFPASVSPACSDSVSPV